MFFLAELYAKNKREHDHVFKPKELQESFTQPVRLVGIDIVRICFCFTFLLMRLFELFVSIVLLLLK
jgi:hypothetical protein